MVAVRRVLPVPRFDAAKGGASATFAEGCRRRCAAFRLPATPSFDAEGCRRRNPRPLAAAFDAVHGRRFDGGAFVHRRAQDAVRRAACRASMPRAAGTLGHWLPVRRASMPREALTAASSNYAQTPAEYFTAMVSPYACPILHNLTLPQLALGAIPDKDYRDYHAQRDKRFPPVDVDSHLPTLAFASLQSNHRLPTMASCRLRCRGLAGTLGHHRSRGLAPRRLPASPVHGHAEGCLRRNPSATGCRLRCRGLPRACGAMPSHGCAERPSQRRTGASRAWSPCAAFCQYRASMPERWRIGNPFAEGCRRRNPAGTLGHHRSRGLAPRRLPASPSFHAEGCRNPRPLAAAFDAEGCRTSPRACGAMPSHGCAERRTGLRFARCAVAPR